MGTEANSTCSTIWSQRGVVVQSLSCVQLFAPPWTTVLQASLSFTISLFTQTHVHWVSDAIQPSHPLSPPSLTLNLSQHQGLFYWEELVSYQCAWLPQKTNSQSLEAVSTGDSLKATLGLTEAIFLSKRHPVSSEVSAEEMGHRVANTPALCSVVFPNRRKEWGGETESEKERFSSMYGEALLPRLLWFPEIN